MSRNGLSLLARKPPFQRGPQRAVTDMLLPVSQIKRAVLKSPCFQMSFSRHDPFWMVITRFWSQPMHAVKMEISGCLVSGSALWMMP